MTEKDKYCNHKIELWKSKLGSLLDRVLDVDLQLAGLAAEVEVPLLRDERVVQVLAAAWGARMRISHVFHMEGPSGFGGRMPRGEGLAKKKRAVEGRHFRVEVDVSASKSAQDTLGRLEDRMRRSEERCRHFWAF